MKHNHPASATSPPPDDGEINLGHILDSLYDGRWLIFAITLVFTLLGGLYAFMAKPVYEANLLIQVEDAGRANSLLGQAAPLLEGKTATLAEIEIIRSRMVISRAVDNLRLYIQAQPVQVPLIGSWLSRRATGLSEPGFLGWGGYVWGTEQIKVKVFNVPDALTGQTFTITQGQGPHFTLQLPDEGAVVQGEVGKLNAWVRPEGSIELQVTDLQAKPGAQFEVVRNSRLAIIEGLQASISMAERGNQSGMIQARLQGASPVFTAAVLNEVGHQYVQQNIDRKTEEAGKTLQFLDQQLPQIRQELEAAETRYNAFRNTSGIVNLTAEGDALLGQSVTAQTQLIELRQKRQELMSRFTPEHPSVQTLDRQMAEAQAQVAKVTQQSRKLPALEQETLRLTRDVKVNTELYVGLLQSAQRLKLIQAGQVGSVRLIDTAVVPERPVKPARPVIVLLSLLLGLAAGAAAVYVRKLMHAGIDDPNAIERRLGLTVFATVPHSDQQVNIFKLIKKSKGAAHKPALLSTVDNADPAIESLRSLRTALQFAMLDAPNSTIMITGATPALGKSFISANFANVLAAGGKRVLLIDADLRKGYLHEYFGLNRGLGLSSVISGSVALDAALRQGVLPQLDMLTTGPLPPNPAELLLSDRLPELLQSLSARYDHILIDSPPALLVSDAAVLGRFAGACFLVVREGQSTLGEIEEAHKRLTQSGVHVNGVLYNDIQPRASRYGSKYSYRYSHDRYVQTESSNNP
jgi:tyrosine-protein kinase Etk/Wzc